MESQHTMAPLRVSIEEAAFSLRISRALLYQRIAAGHIAAHHDGRRAFIAMAELRRYVAQQAGVTA